jgi:hypothetical protein
MVATPDGRRETSMHAVRRTAFALVALALVAGACGDDDDDDAATDTTAATVADATDTTAGDTTAETTADTTADTADEPGDAPAGDLAAYCDAMLAYDQVESPGGPVDPTPEEVAAWATDVQPLMAAVAAAAPDEVSEAVEAMQTALDEAAAGDPALVNDPATFGAMAALEGAAYEGCGFTQVDVTAGDYLYEGVPESVPAGPLAIRLTNAGSEPHIILAIQRAEGNTTPAEELVDEFFAAVGTGGPPPPSVVGGMAGDPPFALPGGGVGGKVTDLAPGSYVLFCPIGTLADESVTHYQEGMIAELEVVG